MPIDRAERKFNLGLGTIGLILTVAGAAWDNRLDGVPHGMTIFGIVAASIGMMMMATSIVKESTTCLNSTTGLDLRILSKGGILTAFGGISILIGLMIELMIKEFLAHEDVRIQVGWSWWLMFIGVWFILVTCWVDLCNRHFPVDTGNVGGDNENEGDEIEDMINDLEVRNERENIGNESENEVNEESQM